MTTVLLVDPDEAARASLGPGLRARGYDVEAVGTAEQALSAAVLRRPALLVLELGLPDLDGVELIRRLRLWTALPALVLSSEATEARKVEALDAGADDYLVKPCGLGEIDARLRVALRHRAAARPLPEEPVLDVGPLRIDLGRRAVSVAGRPVELTARELDLLAFLARHAGKVVTHQMALERVWGPDRVDDTHSLRVYVNRLRAKLEADPANPRLLQTSAGVGYRLAAAEGSDP